jgi:ribosomal subunit interface protein
MAKDFLIQITNRHEEKINDPFKDYMQTQISKLARYNPSIIDAKVIIDKEHNALYRVDISIQVPGAFLAGKASGFEYPKAFDEALEKAKIQLKKHRDRIIDHKPRQAAELAGQETLEGNREEGED